MALVNVMEQIVEDRLMRMLEGENCCKCERCIDDMKAYALNRLPSKYVSSFSGELFSKLSSTMRQNTVDIDIAVASAIDCVSAKPSHQIPLPQEKINDVVADAIDYVSANPPHETEKKAQ